LKVVKGVALVERVSSHLTMDVGSSKRGASIGRRSSGALLFNTELRTSSSAPVSPLKNRTGSSIGDDVEDNTRRLVNSLSLSSRNAANSESQQLCKDLLEQPSLVIDVVNKAIDIQSLSSLLHRFFTMHHREWDLFKWAVDSEITTNMDSLQVIFRGDSLAARTLYLRTMTEEGMQFLSHIYAPLMDKISNHKAVGEGEDKVFLSLECEFKKKELSSEEEENLRWYIDTATEFLGALCLSADSLPRYYIVVDETLNCISSIRKSFAYLRSSLERNLDMETPENRHYLLCSIIFLRFCCPGLTSPKTFGLLPPEWNEKARVHIQRRLINVSKLIQIVANRAGGMTYHPLYEDFLEKQGAKVSKFVYTVTTDDAAQIQRRKLSLTGKMRTSMDDFIPPHSQSSSDLMAVYKQPTDPQAQEIEDQLRDYLQNHYLTARSNSTMAEMSYQMQQQAVLDAHRGIMKCEWKSIRSSRKREMALWEAKGKEHLYKVVCKFRADLGLLYDIIKHFSNFVKFCPFITHAEPLEIYDDNASDWYIQTKGGIGSTSRDYVFTNRTFSNEKMAISCYYSVNNEKAPPTKFTRGSIKESGFILERDILDPEITTMVAVVNWSGGNAPYKRTSEPATEIYKAMKAVHKDIFGKLSDEEKHLKLCDIVKVRRNQKPRQNRNAASYPPSTRNQQHKGSTKDVVHESRRKDVASQKPVRTVQTTRSSVTVTFPTTKPTTPLRDDSEMVNELFASLREFTRKANKAQISQHEENFMRKIMERGPSDLPSTLLEIMGGNVAIVRVMQELHEQGWSKHSYVITLDDQVRAVRVLQTTVNEDMRDLLRHFYVLMTNENLSSVFTTIPLMDRERKEREWDDLKKSVVTWTTSEWNKGRKRRLSGCFLFGRLEK
ncbi:hypothetical protein PROFUN_15395, partial [Planoprotostelium fungivorum]